MRTRHRRPHALRLFASASLPPVGRAIAPPGFRPRGEGLSAPDSARYFADRNGITTGPTIEQLPHRPDSGETSVTVTRWRQEGKAGVTLYTVVSGGHAVPNPTKRALFMLGRTARDINAADIVADLIAAQN